MEVNGSVTKTLGGRAGQLELAPHIRYGFHNMHLNPWATLSWRRRKFVREDGDASASRQTWTLAGGKKVEQFDAQEPISETVNDFYTLFGNHNYMKIYEKYFIQLGSEPGSTTG